MLKVYSNQMSFRLEPMKMV